MEIEMAVGAMTNAAGLVRGIAVLLAAGLADLAAIERSSAQAVANAVSYWSHNGSVIALTVDGAGRRFYYEAPRNGLQSIGVTPGTLLFSGRKDGDRYSGTAFIFAPRCPPTPYEVSGSVSANDEQVTMYGQAPRVGADCRVTGYRADTLTFRFERTVQQAGQPPANTASPRAKDDFSQQLEDHLADTVAFTNELPKQYGLPRIYIDGVEICTGDDHVYFELVNGCDTHLYNFDPGHDAMRRHAVRIVSAAGTVDDTVSVSDCHWNRQGHKFFVIQSNRVHFDCY
jgi:hypothetical protein